jgi:hypothetical protein
LFLSLTYRARIDIDCGLDYTKIQGRAYG